MFVTASVTWEPQSLLFGTKRGHVALLGCCRYTQSRRLPLLSGPEPQSLAGKMSRVSMVVLTKFSWSWLNSVAPSSRIVVWISSLRTAPHQYHHITCRADLLCIALSTPSVPKALRANMKPRPRPTAFTPRQSAFTTSAPRHTPPSK